MIEQYQFSEKGRRIAIISMLAGLLCLVLGYFIHADNPARTWGNLLLCSYYFVGLGIGSLFFYAVSYTAKSGWSVVMLRVPEAFANTLILSAILLVLVVAGGLLTHTLYQTWAAPGIATVGSHNFDPLVLHKRPILNVPTFIGGIGLFMIVWIIFGKRLRSLDIQQDLEGASKPLYKKTFITATAFLVVFAVSQSLFSFMVMMSNEAHEASTMFGWYNFGGIWVTSLSAITLFLVLLKENGYYKEVNENHLQNLGTLMFAFTIFFTYTWFFQFMLTWYSNMGDESFYITQRWRADWGYKFIYWLNIGICFVIPFFGLLTSDAKRNAKTLKIMAVVIILGHWLDWFLQVMPGTVKGNWGIDLPEIGAFLLFAGLASYSVMYSLAKLPMRAKDHPYLEESLHHHIENV